MKESNKGQSKVKDFPRMSVNQICEYVADATATRRASIIKQAKQPSPIYTKWYNQAEDILSYYLSAIKDDSIVLRVEAQRLLSKSFTSEMDKKFNHASSGSILSFLHAHDVIKEALAKYSLEQAVNDNQHKLILNGVQISLRPELVLRDADGKEQLGFVKFYFSKNTPITKPRAEMMACLTKHYFETGDIGFKFKRENCFVLDVYAGKLYTAPKAHVRYISNIKAACQEIADRWHLI